MEPAAASLDPPTPEARRRFYEEHGYLLVPDVLPPDEVAAIAAELDGIASRLRVRRGSLEAAWPGRYRRRQGSIIMRQCTLCT